MKIAQLVGSGLLIFSIVESTQADWPSGGNWWWYYYNFWISSQPGPAGTTPGELNSPPSISGNPASTATAGQSYSFTPSASDPEGDSLTFSVTNLPVWASFNNLTGTLSGTPGTASVGSYEDILISVSDASATVSLDPISILVNPAIPPTGSVELSWINPTSRTDLSPLSLSDIDGYRIYMGENRDSLSMIVDLNDGAASRYSVTELALGTYFFAIKVYDVAGNESALSNIVDKSVVATGPVDSLVLSNP